MWGERVSEDGAADEFMGHRPGPAPGPPPPRPDAGGYYTLTGEARNVRSFSEDTGWGEHRETIQVVSFTLDQFASGGLTRSVYAEVRGRTIARRPVENEVVTVTGRFAGGRFDVHTLVGLRDDPGLPIHDVPAGRRRRSGLLPLGCGCAVLMLLGFGALVALLFFGVVRNIPGLGSILGQGSGPHVVQVTGPGPWIVEGDGFRYEIVSATRTTTTPFMGEPSPALAVRGFVTNTAHGGFANMDWELRNQDSFKLQGDPVDPTGATIWEAEPTPGQKLPIMLVVIDSKPGATTLTLTVTDFFHRDEPLILRDIPVKG
jgi:hypothetical protein